MVTRELGALAPHVVGLQEASITHGRGNVAARLATALGLHFTHASATRRVSGLAWIDGLIVRGMNFEEGPAILSRFPIVERSVVDLPRCRRFYDPRVLLRATVRTPRGPLDVFSTHTGHDACQVRRIVEVVGARRGPLPALVMGDFNAADTTDWMAALGREHGFVDAFRAVRPAEPGATVWQRPGAPTSTVTRRVDFIFVVPNGAPPRACARAVSSSTRRRGAPTARRSGPPTTTACSPSSSSAPRRRRAEPCRRQDERGRAAGGGAGAGRDAHGVRRGRSCPPWG